MSRNKQLTINLVASILAFIINMGISFFLTPYITKNIGVEAYGFVSLGTQFINYASLITVALNSMAGRFITIEIHKENWENANKYFNSVLLSNVIVAGAMLIPSILVVAYLDKLVDIPRDILLDVKVLFGFLFTNYLISILVSSFGVSTFATNKLHIKSAREIEATVLKAVLLIILFFMFEPAVYYLGFTTVIVMFYISFFNIYYTKKFLPKIKISKTYFEIKAVLELISSGIWNTISKLSGILSTGLDLLIANAFIGATAMGSLALAKTLPTVILSFFGVLGGVFAPQLTFYYAQNDMTSMQRELIKSIKLMGIFACIPVVFLFVYGDIFYQLWVPAQNPLLLQRLSILSCAAFIFSLPIEGLWNIFTIVNKVKTVSIFLLLSSLLSVFITFVLMFLTDDVVARLYIIAGISTIFSIVRAVTFVPLYGAYCLKLNWKTFYPSIISNIILVVGMILASSAIRKAVIIDSWFALLLVGFFIALTSLAFSYFVILNKNEKEALKNMILFKKT